MKRATKLLSALAPILLFAARSHAADLPNLNRYYASAPVLRAPETRASTPRALVASFDDERRVPTFLWAAPPDAGKAGALAALSPEAAARSHLAQHAARYGLSAEALANAYVTQIHDLGRGGVIVAFRQRVLGADVFHSDSKVLMNRKLDLVAIGGALHSDAVAHPKDSKFGLTDKQAVVTALSDLYGKGLTPADLGVFDKTSADSKFYALGDAGSKAKGIRFTEPARVKRVFFPLPDRIVPAYFVEVITQKTADRSNDSYDYVISARDGSILYRENLTHNATFSYRAYANPAGDKRPADGPLMDFTPHPTGIPDGSYPGFSTPNLISIDGFNKNADPWLDAAATESRGNNVDAYTDDDQPDGFSANDIRAAISGPSAFDYTYDLTADPQANNTQKMAAITDLFYVTNWLHDWWYDSGFDEAAGNAQQSNYGRGGVENDPLHAEAQDGAPGQRNNSNMSAHADGTSPRMQMFVWDGIQSSTLGLTPPGMNFPNGQASFGPQTFSVSGTVILANDATGTVTDACEALVGNYTGLIVAADRGQCTFASKAGNAQAAGAIGMIIIDNAANANPPTMGGNGPGVMIAMQSLTQNDGNTLKTNLMNGPVTANMDRSGAADRDGTIENSVIAHEWGHYIHLRQVACGNAQCSAQSEGWGDFMALQMILKSGDNLDGAYAMAQYAVVAFPDDPGYFGIRRYPYSADFTKEPLTFKHITSGQALPAGVPVATSIAGIDNAEVHSAGEVWAAMMFESFVALLKNSQIANAPYTFDEARRRMSDYVEGGFKLAPTDPTYTEMRDAVLATALAADMNDFLILANAFARRGAGTCAVSPARSSTDFSGVVESFTLSANASIDSVAVDDSTTSCDLDGILDAQEAGKVTVKVSNSGSGQLMGATMTVSTKTAGVTFPNGAMQAVPVLDPFQSAVMTFDIAADDTITMKEPMDLSVDVAAPSACAATTSLATSPLINYDIVPMSTATDDVEAPTTTWTIAGQNSSDIWSITEPVPGNHVWRGIDYGSPSDTTLTSPALQVDPAANLVLTFDERHQFETSMGILWDGGVIEVSTDGGTTWNDISMYGNPPYAGQIGDPNNMAMNVLKGRQGFVDHNASYPMTDQVVIDMGQSLAGQSAMFRFRIGTDDAKGEFGWEIDNIAFQGITNKPFTALVDDTAACTNVPKADAGPDQTVFGGDTVTLDGSKSSDPAMLPLSFDWSETNGPMVSLMGGMTAMPTFTAPMVAASTTLTFKLAVNDGKAGASDTVDILVKPKGTMTSTSSGMGGGGGASASGSSGTGAAPGSNQGGATDDSGCGCGAVGTPSTPPFAASLGLLALLGLRRRRRIV